MKRECLSRQIADVKKRASPEKDRTGRLAVIDFVQSAARHGMAWIVFLSAAVLDDEPTRFVFRRAGQP